MAADDHRPEGAGTGAASFATTHWSVVLAAGHPSSPNGRQALEQLYRTYWFPLYAHVRRRGYTIEETQDLTQEFFAHLLAKHWLTTANSRRGRFRSFLLAAMNHFLANDWNRAHAGKRGGSLSHLPFDTSAAEQLYLREPGHGLNAEELYERNWALQFLEHVRTKLREEYAQAGQGEHFELLESFLPGRESGHSYAEVANGLGIPEGTLKSDVHRLKQRYGRVLRREIAHTVSTPEEIEDELRHLLSVLAR